ncbi:FAD dependent oxidoreductase [Paenibacillus curdlanolyticus YK9]|uniref:FAD dependent oxidoreductase n=1 Tax=Paenibacillus curdlanolyticus YK9 TaxID=717606 RepID=E0I6E4_9BACL|nr:tryptophan 7-halogenase [Paenibacillus curdlanolyticus]EFM11610.1 FAD dependent oxidoreductase [Paenibacillus curdlanolyticus YK9]
MEKQFFDVAIIGSGVAGATLAAVLARHNVKTLVLDGGTHPKFAIGESMIPTTSFYMRSIAERYDVPEIMNCSTLPLLRDNISSMCGIKRNFSFVYQRPGEAQNPKEMTQLPVPNIPYGAEAHLYRQDTDAYLHAVSVRYGAVVKQRTMVTNLTFEEDQVIIETSQGTFYAKFLVDGSGMQSVLAKQKGLREEPTRMKANTGSIFTHMIDVAPLDEFYKKGDLDIPSPLHKGTLHHIFDGGWLWVIPFNNHKDAKNPLVSVGLQFDHKRLDKLPFDINLPPEEMFAAFLDKFPDIAKQFANAKPVRDWVKVNRLQYSAHSVIGHRYCLMAHAACFIDPLFSRGLAITSETIFSLAQQLIDATKENDFNVERFSRVGDIISKSFDTNDRLVNCSYIAFRNFELWNAWYRVWTLGQAYTSLRFTQVLSKYYKGDKEGLLQLEQHPFVGSLCGDLPEFQELFDKVASILEAVGDEELDVESAITRIYQLYSEIDYVPEQYELTNPDRHYISKMDGKALLDIVEWGTKIGPERNRKLYFDMENSSSGSLTLV